MENDNIRIAYRFWSDQKAFLSYTSEAGNMVASNLQNTQPSSVWRSTSAVDQTIVIDLNGLRKISFLCLYNHNLTFNGTITLYLGQVSNFSSYDYTITVNVVQPIYGIATQPLGIYPLGGYSSEGVYLPFTVIWVPDIVCQYAKVVISDTVNPSGYIQCGRLLLGEYWSPTWNFEPGASIKRVSNSKQIIMRSGATRANRLPSHREMSFQFKNVVLSETLIIDEIQSLVDMDKNIFVAAYPTDNSAFKQLTTIMGFLTEWG